MNNPPSIWVIYWDAARRQYVLQEWLAMLDGSVMQGRAPVGRGSWAGIHNLLPLGLTNLGNCQAQDRTIREIWV